MKNGKPDETFVNFEAIKPRKVDHFVVGMNDCLDHHYFEGEISLSRCDDIAYSLATAASYRPENSYDRFVMFAVFEDGTRKEIRFYPYNTVS